MNCKDFLYSFFESAFHKNCITKPLQQDIDKIYECKYITRFTRSELEHKGYISKKTVLIDILYSDPMELIMMLI